jgi:simple sugar transport system ATP-binding protein
VPDDLAVAMRGIDMTFPGVRALSGVAFTLRKGEIHALMGENGAGKSTLIKVLTGVYAKGGGEIFLEGSQSPTTIRSPQEAQDHWISTVYQEISLLPNLTVEENLFLGRAPRRFHLIDWRGIAKRSRALLERLGIPADPGQQLSECSLAVQQMIAIARAVDQQCRVLILDEPTSSLDDEEVARLFALMRQLRDQGVGIVFVTHFLEQVYEVCDRITVLRNGELVGEYEIKDLPRTRLVAAMMGKEFDDLAAIKSEKESLGFREGQEPFLSVRDLSSATAKPFDLDVYRGEVVGFTGLLGSGRSEAVRAICAADKPTGGSMTIEGAPVKLRTPLDAMNHGIAYLPEDRKRDGIIADLSVRENIIIALQAERGVLRPISGKEAQAFADEYIELLNIKTASADTPIRSLSGGNQQKVIIARWLLTHPEYLILDEPTRGIDVGTKTEIQKLMLRLADEGISVTFISSEIEEMLRTCSRLIVMRDGEKVGELTGDELNQDTIMKTIAGGE